MIYDLYYDVASVSQKVFQGIIFYIYKRKNEGMSPTLTPKHQTQPMLHIHPAPWITSV